MSEFKRVIQVRWSDLDPNFHVRHSVYYDWGAYCRIEFFNEFGLTDRQLMEHHIGPILFREECIFRREINMKDQPIIYLQATHSRKDYSRWSIQHIIMKDAHTVAATINVDGAWIDLHKRKLSTPPAIVHDVFEKMPKSEGFHWQ